MKKSIYYLPILLLVFITSSCTPSKEDVIKSAFKNYVASNFDDPKSLKEIVEINSLDTITHNSFKTIVTSFDEMDKLLDETDSIIKIKNHELDSFLVVNNSRYRGYKRDQIGSVLSDGLFELQRQSRWFKDEYPTKERLRIELDSLLNNLTNIVINSYEIKTRINNNGSLKLQSYYAIEDNIRNEMIIIDHKPVFDDYPQIAKDFYKTGKEFEQIQNNYHDIINRKMELSKLLQSLI